MKKIEKRLYMGFRFPKSTRRKLEILAKLNQVSLTEALRQLIDSCFAEDPRCRTYDAPVKQR